MIQSLSYQREYRLGHLALPAHLAPRAPVSGSPAFRAIVPAVWRHPNRFSI
jgi:hypothetical protein